MPEEVECDECGEQFDTRGLAMHRRMKHGDSGRGAVTDGGSGVEGSGVVTVEKDELDVSDEDIDAALPAANVTNDAITFRSVQEIEVADEEMKRELLEELKEYIRGGTLRM
jgi:hypothetical protein